MNPSLKYASALALAAASAVAYFTHSSGSESDLASIAEPAFVGEKAQQKQGVVSAEAIEKPPASHRTIQRPHAYMDQVILGQDGQVQHQDSRSAKRVLENRALLAVDLENGLKAKQRVAHLRALSTLSPQEKETLFEAIYQDQLPQGVSRASWNWVVDVMMTTLRTRGAEPAEMVEHFTRTFDNTNADLTVRDYALQHLGHIKGEGGNIEVIDAVMQRASAEKQGTLAGTALLALDNTIDWTVLTDDERQQRGQNALMIAEDESYSLESRVTALQVAARHQPAIVADLAETIIGNENSSEILKLSAQAALR